VTCHIPEPVLGRERDDMMNQLHILGDRKCKYYSSPVPYIQYGPRILQWCKENFTIEVGLDTAM